MNTNRRAVLINVYNSCSRSFARPIVNWPHAYAARVYHPPPDITTKYLILFVKPGQRRHLLQFCRYLNPKLKRQASTSHRIHAIVACLCTRAIDCSWHVGQSERRVLPAPIRMRELSSHLSGQMWILFIQPRVTPEHKLSTASYLF